MRLSLRLATLLVVVVLLIAACDLNPQPTPSPTSEPPQSQPAETAAPATASPSTLPSSQVTDTPGLSSGQPLNLAIIWHQHQPVYFKDPETGVYAKPWVRVHAAKDYVDMAAMVEQYPGIHVTFNLTPSLLRQIVSLGPADTGDRFTLRAVHGQLPSGQPVDLEQVPGIGPAVVAVPDLGLTTTVLGLIDPEGDDDGPGTYLYPTDGVFGAGAFDLTSFSVGYSEEDIVFKFTVAGPVENVWNSPNGLSVQTFDIYIDQDGPQNGARLLLPGRNAALAKNYGWDYAIWVEGWYPGIYVPGPDGPEQVDAQWTVLVDPGQSKITVQVPKDLLGDDPASWSYAAVVLGQEGYPATGVWRVRDVEATAKQWRFGGAPDDTNHTRILDLAWPAEATPDQAAILGSYVPSQETNMDALGPDDFAQVPMLAKE